MLRKDIIMNNPIEEDKGYIYMDKRKRSDDKTTWATGGLMIGTGIE